MSQTISFTYRPYHPHFSQKARAKKMTRHRVVNPLTGRLVLKTGAIGRALKKPKAMTKATKVIKKIKVTVSRPVGRAPNDKNGRAKKWDSSKGKWVKGTGGPVKGKYYGYEGATKKPSPLTKTAGKTKNYATRPSARAFYDRGEYGPVCYGGKCHVMAFRSNGSPYWCMC